MKKASRIIAGFAALGFAVSACGDDEGSTGTSMNSGDPLTTAEALAVYGELQAALNDALAPPIASAAAEPIPTTTANCDLGGSISLSGDVSQSGDNITFTLNEDINGCVISSGGVTFTVNGAPRIVMSGDISFSGTTLSGTFDMTGGFDYTSDDGRAGGCAMDVTVDYGTFAVSGTICGNSISG